MALDAALNGTDQITKTLTLRRLVGRRLCPTTVLRWPVSSILAAFRFPLASRRSCKTRLYNYTTSIYDYDSNKWNDSRYRTDDTGFNVDAGIAADFGENWTVGVSGQNLMSRDIDTKDIRIRNGRTGEVVSYKDTYQIRPLVTAGAARHNDLVTLTADGDLTETKGFKSEDTSQYVGVGAEVTPLSWLAVRAGYRADMKGNDSNVFTGGVGFAPFNAVHVDLMGLYGEDETGAQGHS